VGLKQEIWDNPGVAVSRAVPHVVDQHEMLFDAKMGRKWKKY